MTKYGMSLLLKGSLEEVKPQVLNALATLPQEARQRLQAALASLKP